MPERKEIKYYLWLIWLGVLLSLAAVALIAFSLNQTLKAESEAAFQKNLNFLAESSAKSIKLFFDGVISEIVLLSEIDAVKQYKLEEVDLAFRGVIAKHNERISHMILLNNKGEIKVMVTKAVNPFKMKSQINDFFRESMAVWRVSVSRNLFVSENYRGLAVGMPIFRKLKRRSGAKKGPSWIYASGTLMALVGVDDLVRQLIDPILVEKAGIAWLYTGGGDILASEERLAGFTKNIYGIFGDAERLGGEFGKVINGEKVPGWSTLNKEGKTMEIRSFNDKWFVSTAKIKILDQEWTLAVAAPQSSATHILTKSFIQTAALFAFMVGILLFGGFMITRLYQSQVRAEAKALYASELEEKNRSLKSLTKRMDEFLAIVSHDIRSPLSVIVGFVKMIQSAPNGNQFKRETTTMLRSSNRLMQLVNDILDVSKLEARKVLLAYEPLAIDDVITESFLTMELGAKEKEQDISLCLGEKTIMEGDGAKLLQVMNNLIANAIKFTPKGGRIAVNKTMKNGNVVISVSDTGPGIPADQQGMVFDKFEQVKHHQQGIEPGSGLGLTICKNLVDLHMGEITVSSNPGEGSTFCITLPLKPPRQTPRAIDGK